MGILATKTDDKDLDDTVESEPTTTKVVSIEQHFERRFLRFMHLGGMGQYISSVTGLQREEIFRSGASRHQDQTCLIPDHRAAHVVRALVSHTIRTKHLELFKGVAEFLARIDLIPSAGNFWHTIGGEIDRVQESFLKRLNTIVFNARKTAEITLKLKEYRDAFVEVFNTHIDIGSRKYTREQIVELKKVRDKLRTITAENMFVQGQLGLTYLKPWNM